MKKDTGIEFDSNGCWTTKEFRDTCKALEIKSLKRLIFHTGKYDISEQRAKQNPDNLKWAYIMVGKTRVMCWVDNATNKAYKADGYSKTTIEIKKFTFVRWCTSFDL